MTENLEAIRGANDIVSVIGAYLPLKKAGTEWRGLCPFHTEKRPSFSVNPGKQLYLCRSCGAGGDVFRFVQHVERVGFREAKELLASRAGISVTPATATEVKTWAKAADEQELMQHFGFVEGVASERAGAAFRARCAADLEYRGWLTKDLVHAQALAGVLIGIIAVSQERDGDYPQEQTA